MELDHPGSRVVATRHQQVCKSPGNKRLADTRRTLQNEVLFRAKQRE